MIWIYRAFAPVALFVASTLGAAVSHKIRRGLYLRWRQRWRPSAKQPIWIHAASGEFEYAKPVLTKLKEMHPHQPVIVTYFSPTFAGPIQKFPGIDQHGPLPVDLPWQLNAFLKSQNPSLLLIARTDLWPELLHQARRHHIPTVLFSATQSEFKKTPLAGLGRTLKTWLLNQLTEIHCVANEDAEQMRYMGVTCPILVDGDTRYDQVFARLQNPKPLSISKDVSGTTTLPVIVAGSTWPEDERVLLDALQQDLHGGTLKLILVPHEPTPAHIATLSADLPTRKIPFQLYSDSTSFEKAVLLVDRVGILAELYTLGDIAFVGGSFRRSVHSVMEPLAVGLPVVVGPHHKNNREALEFQKEPLANTLAMVTAVNTPKELSSTIQTLIKNPTKKSTIQAQVQKRQGATTKLIDTLKKFPPLKIEK